jgi:ATP-dependent RNA helicase DHX37/DHR1
MAELREKLAAKPLLASRPEGKTQMRVIDLVGTLKRHGICTRQALKNVWMSKNPRFLYPELKAWLRQGKGYLLEQNWDKIVKAVVTDAAVKGTKKKRKKDK